MTDVHDIVRSFKFILKVGVEVGVDCERTVRINDYRSAV
jgi:hypothetical protein